MENHAFLTNMSLDDQFSIYLKISLKTKQMKQLQFMFEFNNIDFFHTKIKTLDCDIYACQNEFFLIIASI